MNNSLQHPDIALARLRGVPEEREELCPCCGGAMGEFAFETSPGRFVCRSCFQEEVEELLRRRPLQLAEMLCILWQYRS